MIAACPRVAFIRRTNYGMAGMQSVMFAQRTGRGSAICVYDPACPKDGAKVIFETTEGFIFNMNPSYDGKRLVFSYKQTPDDQFHVWEIATDGSGLRQLTRGPYHDFSPVYYPDGRIIFSSSRVESYSLCQNYLACALYAIEGDGSGMRRIDWTTLCTLTPAVLEDGSILCTRWEYQDKNIFGWGGLWTVNPNGRQLKLYHGNTFRVPNIVYGGREIPGTKTAIVVWTGHHRQPLGDLAIVDRRKGLETPQSMWKITHVTPVTKDIASGKDWTKSGVGAPGADAGYGSAFTDPFPFSSEYSLVSYAGRGRRGHALWVLDHATGQTALLYETKTSKVARAAKSACFSPVPLAPRKKPAPSAVRSTSPIQSRARFSWTSCRGRPEAGRTRKRPASPTAATPDTSNFSISSRRPRRASHRCREWTCPAERPSARSATSGGYSDSPGGDGGRLLLPGGATVR